MAVRARRTPALPGPARPRAPYAGTVVTARAGYGSSWEETTPVRLRRGDPGAAAVAVLSRVLVAAAGGTWRTDLRLYHVYHRGYEDRPLVNSRPHSQRQRSLRRPGKTATSWRAVFGAPSLLFYRSPTRCRD